MFNSVKDDVFKRNLFLQGPVGKPRLFIRASLILRDLDNLLGMTQSCVTC